MADRGNTVKLVFAGDDKDLQKTIDNVGKSTSSLGDRLKSGAKGIAGAGAAIGTAYVAAFASSVDFSASQAKLQAQLGAGTPLAADAGAAAGDVYASGFGDSLDEVNAAMRSVIQQGVVMEDASKDQMAGVTKQALALSQAFGLDVNDSVAAVAQMMRTGLAPDAKTAFDIITRGEQQGVDKAGDLLDTVTEYSTQFRKVGIDGTQAMGLLSQGLQAGARDADTVADAIKEFSIRAVDGSKTTAQGFTSIGLNAQDMAAKIGAGGASANAALDLTLDRLRAIPDPVQRSQAAVALFGTKAEDLGGALYALDPSSAVAAMGQVAGATDQVGQTLQDTAQNKIESIKRGFEEWTNSMVNTQGPIGDVSSVLVAFGEPITNVGTMVGTLALAFRGVGLTLFTTAIPAVWSFTTALLANPITWIILGVIALVAAIVLLITHFDWVKSVATTVINWIGDRFEWVKNVVSTAAGWVRDRFVDAFNWVRNTASGVVNWFASLPGRIGGIFSSIGQGIKNGFSAGLNGLKALWNNTIGRIGFSIPSWVPLIGGKSFHMPRFHVGGDVPSNGGVPYPAMLLPGERVISQGQTAGGTVVIRSDGSSVSELLLQVLREVIHVEGGDVQAVLGS